MARLVVSELVTNAWRHGEGQIILRVFRDTRADFAVLEVWDQGTGCRWSARRTSRRSRAGPAAGVATRARLGNSSDHGRRKDRLGQVRPVSVQVERYVLRWRTRLGRATAIRHLDLLALAVQAKGYRHVKLYQADEIPTRPPVLWVFAFSPDDHVRVAVSVHAMPSGGWAYCEAGRGRHSYLSPAATPSTPLSRWTPSSSTACSRPPGNAAGGIAMTHIPEAGYGRRPKPAQRPCHRCPRVQSDAWSWISTSTRLSTTFSVPFQGSAFGTVISAGRCGRSSRTGWSKPGRPPIWPANSTPLCPARVPTSDPSRTCAALVRPHGGQTAPGRPRSPPPGNRRSTEAMPVALSAGSSPRAST